MCVNLDLRQDGEEGGGDAEEHVDADEDLVLGAAIRVGVEHVEQDQSHHRQQVVERRDRQQSCGCTQHVGESTCVRQSANRKEIFCKVLPLIGYSHYYVSASTLALVLRRRKRITLFYHFQHSCHICRCSLPPR